MGGFTGHLRVRYKAVFCFLHGLCDTNGLLGDIIVLLRSFLIPPLAAAFIHGHHLRLRVRAVSLFYPSLRDVQLLCRGGPFHFCGVVLGQIIDQSF